MVISFKDNAAPIQSKKDLDDLIKELKKAKVLAIDTETGSWILLKPILLNIRLQRMKTMRTTFRLVTITEVRLATMDQDKF